MVRNCRAWVGSVGVGVALLFGSGPAIAARDVALELNKLESVDKACRAYFLVKNDSADQFSEIRLDMFIFDKNGVISRRFAISTGQLRPGKTVVRLFDIPDLDCSTVARLLVNDVISCAGPAGAPVEACGERLVVTARSGLQLDY